MISLITGVGASGQVGEAVATHLAQRGDRVILVSRDANEVRTRAEELAGQGLAASAYGCDLSDSAQVDDLAKRVRTEHGARLDALVNLAGGFGSSGPLAESDPAALDLMARINLSTAFQATRAFLPLVREGRGAIVYFASDAILEGGRTKGIAGYAVAKAGVVALMRSVADESRGWGVRANALAPAAIRTRTNEASMGADARYVEREQVAEAVAFLCSPASNAISGQVIRLTPGLSERSLASSP